MPPSTPDRSGTLVGLAARDPDAARAKTAGDAISKMTELLSKS